MPAAAGFPNLGRGRSTEIKNEDYTSTHSIHSTRTLLSLVSIFPTVPGFPSALLWDSTIWKKTEIRLSIYVICIKERSPSVSNLLQGRFLMSPLLGVFVAHMRHPTFDHCLGNIFTSEQYKPRGFQHRITLAITPGLSQEHDLCWQLQR